MATIKQLLTSAHSNLPLSQAKEECEYLLTHICNISRGQQIAHPDLLLSDQQIDDFNQALTRRVTGEPLAYITGKRGFWDMELTVTPDVLIPRPDTECLVEQALLRIPVDTNWNIADLGAGSGAIALALARERPDCEVIATDISVAALKVAKENGEMLALKNISFIEGSWFKAFNDERMDMLISNPPYIAATDPHLQQGDLPAEPQQALASGKDGLDDIRHIIRGAHQNLKPTGYLLLEHGYDQACEVTDLLREHGFNDIFTAKDYGGNERVSGGSMQSAIG